MTKETRIIDPRVVHGDEKIEAEFAVQVEATAILKGLLLAFHAGIEEVHLWSDYKVVCNEVASL